jgi:nucleoside-diphosphate-sugar epimerase
LKILITGANGFTGQHFAKFAHDAGYETISLTSNLNDIPSIELEVIEANADFIAHFAGISFVPSKDQEAFYRVHALGTSNLLNAALKQANLPKKILLASSATVYGNSINLLSDEKQDLSPIDHYAISKVAMEEMAKTYYQSLPIVVARPFNYTGPGQKENFLIPKLIQHFSEKKSIIELGNLEIEREFNDIQTICFAYLSLLEFGEKSETYNVCSGHARSLKLVLDTLIEMTGHSIEIKVNPDFVRANEIRRMCGNPSKLISLLKNKGLQLPIPPLEKTLHDMLMAANKK